MVRYNSGTPFLMILGICKAGATRTFRFEYDFRSILTSIVYAEKVGKLQSLLKQMLHWQAC